VPQACRAGIGQSLAMTATAKCADGFHNVLCSSCDANFEKLADGTCVRRSLGARGAQMLW
jgi:hypothetical protein